MTRRSRSRFAVLPALAATVLASWSCSSGGDTTGTAGAIALGLSATSSTVAPGGQATVVGTVTRSGGFTGNVTITVTGAPTSVTGAVGTVTTVGLVSTATVTLTVSGSATAGTFPITVKASGSGVSDDSKTYTLTISGTGGSGSATVNFSGCAANLQPLWFAYQDGTSGSWTVLAGTNHVYTFTAAQAKVGFAYVDQFAASNFQVNVAYYTNAELTSTPLIMCTPNGTNSMSGTVAGMSAGQSAFVSLGAAASSATFPTTSYTINNIKSGTFDLLGYRTNAATGPAAGDRLIIRRSQLVANLGTIPLLDFSAGEAVPPTQATITTANDGGGSLTAQMVYFTSGCTSSGSLYLLLAPVSPFSVFGVPVGSQQAADFHSLLVGTTVGNNTRGVQEFFHTIANRTITLPTAMTTPVISSLGSSYSRLQSVFTLPAEYNAGATFSYYDALANHSVNISASAGWLGTNSITMSMPLFSGLSAWLDTWPPANGQVTTQVLGTGFNMAGSFCQEGYRLISDRVTLTF